MIFINVWGIFTKIRKKEDIMVYELLMPSIPFIMGYLCTYTLHVGSYKKIISHQHMEFLALNIISGSWWSGFHTFNSIRNRGTTPGQSTASLLACGIWNNHGAGYDIPYPHLPEKKQVHITKKGEKV